ISLRQKQKKLIMLPSETMIWQPEFTDKTLSRKTGAVHFDNFDDAIECCADLGIPFFVDAGNKKLVFWFVRVDDEGYPEIARCTEREFATILAGISAGGMYCPECGTVHWPDGVTPPF
ncbi:hypothetical protein K2D02_004535, partial [Shigella dysenteriae]|nr:hypothetical protein [Shigella dysenteriae]